jgi:beta-phosphoglucomutase-like phosphatase (HAD superfamily)
LQVTPTARVLRSWQCQTAAPVARPAAAKRRSRDQARTRRSGHCTTSLAARKPWRTVWEAARRAGVDPARAAYVADNPSRDVPGSRRAGFGMIIIMLEPADLAKKDLTGENKPDLVIHTLSELLDIFPARQAPRDAK